MGCKAGKVGMSSEARKKLEKRRQYLIVQVRRSER
jgi:hypothetical protein